MTNCTIEKSKQFKALNEMTLIRKSLESDEIVYIEGRPNRAFTDESAFKNLAENGQALVNRTMAIERA